MWDATLGLHFVRSHGGFHADDRTPEMEWLGCRGIEQHHHLHDRTKNGPVRIRTRKSFLPRLVRLQHLPMAHAASRGFTP